MTVSRLRLAALAWAPVPLLLASCSLLPGDAVAEAPAAIAGAHVGGTFTVGVTPPGGIDPVDAYEPVGKLISSTMCDTLVTLDPVTGQVREGLTRSLIFSPDGTTLTFKMRHGLTFNDGTALRPKDVDFSFHVLYSKAAASYEHGLVVPFSAGFAAAAQRGRPNPDSVLADDVAGKASQPIAQALNGVDFQMFASRGNGGAVRALAEPAMAPFSEAAYRKDPVAFSRNPVCVGPYRLDKPYVPGDHAITLVRSPHYYASNVGYTGGGRGYVDKIVFRIYPTPDLAYAAWAKGAVDIVAVPPAKAAQAARFGSSLVRGSATSVEFLGVPQGLEPWSNPAFRQALSLALDRTAIARILGGGDSPARGFLPSALELRAGDNGIRSGALKARAATGTTYSGCGSSSAPVVPDVAGARALLAAARKDSSARSGLTRPLVLYVNNDGPYLAVARLVAAEWKSALGLRITVQPLRWGDYLQKATQGAGFDGAFHFAWATDATAPVAMFNDAQAFLEPVFRSSGESNWEGWSSTDFDFSFTEDAARATDVQSRAAFFRKLEHMLCTDLPMIPVADSAPLYLVRTAKLASARASYLAHATAMPLLREIYLR